MLSHSSQLLKRAAEYLYVLRAERPGLVKPGRLEEITEEIELRGTYEQTPEELAEAGRLAWRNSVRCIGRKYWASLQVRDCRGLDSADEVFAAICEHLALATNGGRIVSTMTVFAAAPPGGRGIRIWNDQLIRYAGYTQANGSVVGDPGQAEITRVIRALGWRGGLRTPFDLLPLVIEMPGKAPRLFELPRSLVLEVEIAHPDYPWFAKLGLRWHALPALSNMTFEAGGLRYTAAPFNGWYMLTEIATRNLADEKRYNMLPVIARRLGLKTDNNRTLWRDRALVELNVAVLHSFEKAGVKMVDHHTAAKHFLEFETYEARQGRPTYADWSWIVPPLSASTTPVYHRPYENRELRPNFFPQNPAWRDMYSQTETPEGSRCPVHGL